MKYWHRGKETQIVKNDVDNLLRIRFFLTTEHTFPLSCFDLSSQLKRFMQGFIFELSYANICENKTIGLTDLDLSETYDFFLNYRLLGSDV